MFRLGELRFSENPTEPAKNCSRRLASQLLVNHDMYQRLNGRLSFRAMPDQTYALDQSRHDRISSEVFDGVLVHLLSIGYSSSKKSESIFLRESVRVEVTPRSWSNMYSASCFPLIRTIFVTTALA